ncbi:MAG TPA: hypothetical protein DCL40_00220 [Coxiellaceae bacterium]|nr:hypothetical protein [Coxiellaceae bacterium]
MNISGSSKHVLREVLTRKLYDALLLDDENAKNIHVYVERLLAHLEAIDESSLERQQNYSLTFFKRQSAKIHPELSDSSMFLGDHLYITLPIEGAYLDVALTIRQEQLVLPLIEETIYVYRYDHYPDHETRSKALDCRRAQEIIVGSFRQPECIRAAIEEQSGCCRFM